MRGLLQQRLAGAAPLLSPERGERRVVHGVRARFVLRPLRLRQSLADA